MSADPAPSGLFDPALLTDPGRRVPLAGIPRASSTPLKGAALIQGDALHLPLADESVDLIVTSPPFLNLRTYTDGGVAYDGQIGSEPTQAEFLEALWAATAEAARVLKPTGSLFVELGDSYADKSLYLTPHRYAIGCIDKLGLLLRAEIIWDRPNGLPESVRDRVRRSHSCWFHLVKQPRYYSAIDEIRESYGDNTHARRKDGNGTGWSHGLTEQGSRRDGVYGLGGKPNVGHPLGKLPGSVWTVSSEPLQVPPELGVDHYAAFPSEFPRRLILGFSPPGICTGCGEGRVPVVDKRFELQPDVSLERNAYRGKKAPENGWPQGEREKPRGSTQATILGYACACTPHTDHPGTGGSSGKHDPLTNAYTMRSGGAPRETSHPGKAGLWDRPRVGGWREYHLTGWTPPPARPAVILDPFCGTGTTVAVARALGRFGVGVDLSADYLRLARWRITASGAAAKAISRTNAERQGTL